MARGDGIHRTSARNAKLADADVSKTQGHNEREKESYSNQDIVPERTLMNVHFKTPTAGYTEMFEQMVADGTISTRGLKADADKFGELVFDVNSAYFYNHGGYDFAKQFYEDAYKAAVKIVGGEQYILSAVMHADDPGRVFFTILRRGRRGFDSEIHDGAFLRIRPRACRSSSTCPLLKTMLYQQGTKPANHIAIQHLVARFHTAKTLKRHGSKSLRILRSCPTGRKDLKHMNPQHGFKREGFVAGLFFVILRLNDSYPLVP